ncbi:MAG: tandem-95 repeat protein [Lysobacteraceae bacterium]
MTITVSATDDPAVITGDSSGSGAEDGGAITGDLDATDADGLTDGTYFTTTSGTNGSASIDPATGAWSYTPNADWHGSDSFTVTVTDDLGGTTTQGVAITVTAVADAVDDSASTSEDTAVLVGNVLANDTFEGVGVAVTAADASSANGGTVVNNGDGTFTYTPALDFTGSDTFTYTASSSTGVAETATVTITVSAVNDNPTLDTALSDQTNDEGDAVSFSVVGNFSDPDAGDTLSYTMTSGSLPAGATFTNGVFGGTLTFASAGSYNIEVTATDGSGASASDTFDWTVTDVVLNDPPVFDPDSYAFNIIQGSGNDTAVGSVSATDPDLDTLEFAITAGDAGGVFTIDAGTGAISVANATGLGTVGTSYSLTLTVSDGNGGTDTATVDVLVVPEGIFADGFED